MPCVFMPYAAANLPEIYGRGGTLNDVLAAPLLRAVRQWQSEYGYGSPELSEEANWMLPCPFRDHFSTLHNWVETLNPKPEEGVAPAALLDEAFYERMLQYNKEQARVVQPLWEKEYLRKEENIDEQR
jgi:hypothetical protein